MCIQDVSNTGGGRHGAKENGKIGQDVSFLKSMGSVEERQDLSLRSFPGNYGIRTLDDQQCRF
jgi:hypothetical protein